MRPVLVAAPALALMGLALAACSERAAPPLAPSLLLLTLDTTRADRLGAYGYAGAETPHLDRLAAEGTLFERAYASTPVTLPSHAGILTGLDPPRHGVRNNGIHFLPEEATTLAELLRERGFATAAFVSAAVLERRYGLAQGFETYDDDLSAGSPRGPRMVAERPAAATVEAALAWLEALSAGRRYFLWIHLFDPHAAYAPPPPFAERFRERPYDGEIAYMDSQLGHLLAHPRAADPSTLVMATGDHGESLGEHGEASHGMLIYDATLRVPWIARGPGVAVSRRIEASVGQVDLLPTVLELLGEAGAARGLELSGTSLAPALSGGEDALDENHRFLYAETLVPFYTYGWAELRSLRARRWKLIDAPEPELYDLESDPGEERNRVESHTDEFRRLRAAFKERLQVDKDPAATLIPDREAAEKLRSLGYADRAGATPSGAVRSNPRMMIGLHAAIERGEQFLFSRDLEQAIPIFEKVLEKDPANLAALADLAKAYAETGNFDEASARIETALALDPRNASLHLTLATFLRRRGEPGRGLAEVEAALTLDPRSLDAGLERVRILTELGREGEARGLVIDLLESSGGSPRLAALHALLVDLPDGRPAEAETRLRAATAREPYWAEGWTALGRVLEQVGRAGEAAETYRRGLEIQPRDPALTAALGLILAGEGSDAEALPYLETALELSFEPRPEVHDALASLANRRGDFAAAEGHSRRALALDRGLAGAWNNLAVALEERGETSGALDAYARARGADPAYWQARFNQGLLLRKLGRAAEAAVAFEEVLEKEPGHGGAHYELGVLYGASLGRPDLAREHLEASLEVEPNHPRAGRVRKMLDSLRPGRESGRNRALSPSGRGPG